MSELKNILQTEDALSSESLLNYLQGNASKEEHHAIERLMADSPFVNDAIEGLQHFKDPELIKEYIAELNRQVQKQTAKKNEKKTKRRLKDQNWLVIAILAILFLCIAGYFLILFIL